MQAPKGKSRSYNSGLYYFLRSPVQLTQDPPDKESGCFFKRAT